MNNYSPLTLWVCLMLGLTGCNKPPGETSQSSDPIKVGEFASLTGKEATFGLSSHNAIQLAIDEINAAGGVLGRKIQLVSEDDQSKAGEAATVTRKLISRDHVVALLGEIASSRSLEAAPIAQKSKIPMISPASTNPRVTEEGSYIFRVCFTDKFQGAVMANFARKALKASKAALLVDLKSDYSKGLAQYFKESFTQDGGQIIAEPSYSGGDKDFKAQLTSIKAANPDILVLPGYYTDVGLIALQAQQLGIKAPLLGGDGWDSAKLVSIGGAAVEGQFFSTHFSAESKSPRVQNFIKSYQSRFNEMPDGMAALGYDAVVILIDAIKRAGSTDGATLRDAIAATKDFDAVTGLITINAERNATKAAVILTVTNGQFRLVGTVMP